MKKEDFVKWPWEWFVSFTLRSLMNKDTIFKMLKNGTREIVKKEHLQVAYIGALVTDPLHRKHLHLFMLGRNKHGKNLLDANKERCEHAWKAGMAKIIEVYYSLGACDYFVKRNMPFLNYDLIFYNNKLLTKTEI